MKTRATYKSPFKAWLVSLPVALGIPAVVWILIERNLPSRLDTWALMIYGVTILVHLCAYLITGLPIFLCLYRYADSPIWTPVIGIPMGALLGVVVVCLLSIAVLGGLGQVVLHEPILYLTGAGYGIATAIAALRQRPQPE